MGAGGGDICASGMSSVCSLRLGSNICRVPSRLGFIVATFAPWCRSSAEYLLAPGDLGVCGRMGAAVGWFGIWGGIVGVFSVVTGWFGGVFRSLECYSWVLD